MSSAVAGAAAGQQHHENGKHTGRDGRGDRQPRRLRPDQRHRRGTGDGVGRGGDRRLCLRCSLFRGRCEIAVGVRQPRCRGGLRRSFLGRCLLRGFLRRVRFFASRGSSWRVLSSPAPSSAPWPVAPRVACSSPGVARAAQVDRSGRLGRGWNGGRVGGRWWGRLGRRRRGLRTFVGSVLLVCHRAAPLQCRVSACPAVAPIMPGRIWRYPVAASPAARASATAITASSASERDRDTTAVARWVRAAGSHNVRFRQPSSTSTTATAIFADNNRP